MEFNTDKLYSKLSKSKSSQQFEFNELIGKKLRYIPSDKVGTILQKGDDLILKWDDGWPIEVILTTEYGQDLIKKSEVISEPIPELYKSIKLTVVADQKSVDIMSDDFTFSLLREMYVIDGVYTDGIGCQVNDESKRKQIEQLGKDISSAFKSFFINCTIIECN